MPIYEFKCPRCNMFYAKLSHIGETGENYRCPDCSSLGLVRKMSGFSSPGISKKGCSTSCNGNCSGCH